MSDRTDSGRVSDADERPSRDSGSPVASPLTIVLTLIAVAAGFLVFRSIGDDDNTGGVGDLPGDTTMPAGPTTPGQTTVSGGAATTMDPSTARITDGGVVVVINAGEVPQSAGAMTTELSDLGYQTEDGVSDNDDDQLEATVVYFSGPGGPEAVARSVAADLGGVTVEAAPSDLASQIAEGDSPGAATVFVMLGTDLSGQSLPLPQAPAAPTIAPTTTTA